MRSYIDNVSKNYKNETYRNKSPSLSNPSKSSFIQIQELNESANKINDSGKLDSCSKRRPSTLNNNYSNNIGRFFSTGITEPQNTNSAHNYDTATNETKEDVHMNVDNVGIFSFHSEIENEK